MMKRQGMHYGRPGTWNPGSHDGKHFPWNEEACQTCPCPSRRCTSSGSSQQSLEPHRREAPSRCGRQGRHRWSCPNSQKKTQLLGMRSSLHTWFQRNTQKNIKNHQGTKKTFGLVMMLKMLNGFWGCLLTNELEKAAAVRCGKHRRILAATTHALVFLNKCRAKLFNGLKDLSRTPNTLDDWSVIRSTMRIQHQLERTQKIKTIYESISVVLWSDEV